MDGWVVVVVVVVEDAVVVVVDVEDAVGICRCWVEAKPKPNPADTRDTADTVCGMVTVAKIRHRTRYHHTRDPNTAGHTKPVTNPSPECRFVLVSFLDVNIVISPVDV